MDEVKEAILRLERAQEKSRQNARQQFLATLKAKHDREAQERKQREDQARQEREKQLKQTMKASWKGTDEAFEKAFPELLEQYYRKQALDAAINETDLIKDSLRASGMGQI
jgi:ADP-ribosylglycohydrolase